MGKVAKRIFEGNLESLQQSFFSSKHKLNLPVLLKSRHNQFHNFSH